MKCVAKNPTEYEAVQVETGWRVTAPEHGVSVILTDEQFQQNYTPVDFNPLATLVKRYNALKDLVRDEAMRQLPSSRRPRHINWSVESNGDVLAIEIGTGRHVKINGAAIREAFEAKGG